MLFLSVASGLVWTAVFTVVGYPFSESFTSAGETATRAGTVAVLVATAAFVVRSRRTRASR